MEFLLEENPWQSLDPILLFHDVKHFLFIFSNGAPCDWRKDKSMMSYMFGNHAKLCGNSFVSHVVQKSQTKWQRRTTTCRKFSLTEGKKKWNLSICSCISNNMRGFRRAAATPQQLLLAAAQETQLALSHIWKDLRMACPLCAPPPPLRVSICGPRETWAWDHMKTQTVHCGNPRGIFVHVSSSLKNLENLQTLIENPLPNSAETRSKFSRQRSAF
jgi:hypothetical protein